MRDRFSTEDACRSYLAELRWPNGIICPACGSKEIWIKKPPLNRCAGCRHDFSMTSGTLFADTHKPLRLWFEAIWDVTNQKSGASALGLQRTLGLGSYRTAWNWLHKLRRAMIRPGGEIVCMALLKLMRHLSAVPALASGDAGRQEKAWCWLRQRRTERKSEGSGW